MKTIGLPEVVLVLTEFSVLTELSVMLEVGLVPNSHIGELWMKASVNRVARVIHVHCSISLMKLLSSRFSGLHGNFCYPCSWIHLLFSVRSFCASVLESDWVPGFSPPLFWDCFLYQKTEVLDFYMKWIEQGSLKSGMH